MKTSLHTFLEQNSIEVGKKLNMSYMFELAHLFMITFMKKPSSTEKLICIDKYRK